MDQLRINESMNGMTISRIDAEAQAEQKRRLASIGSSGDRTGISDGDLLLGLAEDRSAWDPFAIFLRVYGHIANIFGGTITGVFGLFCLVLGALWIKDRIKDLGEWLRKLASFVPGFGFAASVKDQAYDRALDSATGDSFATIIEMVMPAPVYRLINSVVGSGLSAPAPTPAQSIATGTLLGGVAGGAAAALQSGKDKVIAMLRSGVRDGERLTQEEVSALESYYNLPIDELVGG